jgi:hypothetical protein
MIEVCLGEVVAETLMRYLEPETFGKSPVVYNRRRLPDLYMYTRQLQAVTVKST